MSALLDVWFKRETLETLLKGVDQKGMKGIGVTVSINDETNDYEQNVSAFVSQTKEEREAGKKKFYVANGKVFWNDGKIANYVRKQQDQQSSGGEWVHPQGALSTPQTPAQGIGGDDHLPF